MRVNLFFFGEEGACFDKSVGLITMTFIISCNSYEKKEIVLLTQKYDITIKRDMTSLITSKQPGFLVVLFSVGDYHRHDPMMINFNRESITSVQRGQSCGAAEYAKQIFMMAHTELMMHQGCLKVGLRGFPILPPRHLMILAIAQAILT